MRLISTLAAAAALAGCATYDAHDDGRGDYGRYRYEGSAWNARQGSAGPLRGPGVDRLDPWLAETREGSVILRHGWEDARGGFVDPDVAERVNAWFRRYADADRDWCLTDEEIRSALVWAARNVELGLSGRPNRR
ncbi:MAG TPA: hypothetical protein VF552_14475 [Allosphingosinicella sp.]|jgi:hypothetical protein